MVPRQKSGKLARKIASTATAAPVPPIAAPIVNPLRRPSRAIRKEAGTMAAIVPVICNAVGNVAQDLSTSSE